MKFALLFLVIILNSAYCRQSANGPDTAQTDSSRISIRLPDQDQLEKMRREPAFNYNKAEQQPSLLAYIFRKFLELLDKVIGLSNSSWPYRAFLGVLGLIFLFLIIKLLRFNEASFSLLKQANAASLQGNHSDAGPEDIDSLIDSALRQNNFRLAVHYAYTHCLQVLHQQKMITFHTEKTNHEYIKEFSNYPLSSEFQKLTFLFEWIYYRDSDLDESQAKQAVSRYKNFYSVLSAKS